MIHGNKDEVVPQNYSKKFLKFLQQQKKICKINNGDHSLSIKKVLKK